MDLQHTWQSAVNFMVLKNDPSRYESIFNMDSSIILAPAVPFSFEPMLE